MSDALLDSVPGWDDDAQPADLYPAAVKFVVGKRKRFVVTVSAEDYEFLTRHKWNYKISRGGNVYARRGGGIKKSTGELYQTILMHRVVCERAHGPAPSPEHTPDHRNRKTLDNRRKNLVWATKSEQEKNKYRSKLKKKR